MVLKNGDGCAQDRSRRPGARGHAARGFGAFPSRTDRDPAVLRARDWAFLAAVWAGVALAYVVTARLGLLTMTGQIHGLT